MPGIRPNGPKRPHWRWVRLVADGGEELSGTPREHLEFTIWYLVQKRFVERGDSSQLMITVAGVDYLEEGHQATIQRKRLRAGTVV